MNCCHIDRLTSCEEAVNAAVMPSVLLVDQVSIHKRKGQDEERDHSLNSPVPKASNAIMSIISLPLCIRDLGRDNLWIVSVFNPDLRLLGRCGVS